MNGLDGIKAEFLFISSKITYSHNYIQFPEYHSKPFR